MGDQRYAFPLQRRAQLGLYQQSFNAEHHSALTPSSNRDRTASAWKSGLPGAKAVDQYRMAPSASSITAVSPTRAGSGKSDAILAINDKLCY
jgi:hypothetical protein